MTKNTLTGLALAAGFLCAAAPAFAVDGPKAVEIDAGPLGPLDFSAAADGYFFLQSGTADNAKNSIAGSKAAGADIGAWMLQLKKSTGLVQFTIQLAEYADINLGSNKPSEPNAHRYTTDPLRAAYISLAPTPDFKLSIGQVGSLEGFESSFPWNNPVAFRTLAVDGENSNNRGVEADYSQGPFSGSVVFGDGYDTGVWNYLQYLVTAKFDASNSLTVYGGVPLGTTGPNTFAYGEGGASGGGANGNGGQGELAAVNSTMVGGWYTWKSGDLAITPQIQYQWTDPLTKYAAVPSNNIPKQTGNFVADLFGTYKFGDSPWSLGGWAEYARSYGTGAQADWFIAPGASLWGFAFAPGYQYKQLFSRLNVGYVHLLNSGTPAAGFGNQGTGRNQGVVTLEFAFVY